MVLGWLASFALVATLSRTGSAVAISDLGAAAHAVRAGSNGPAVQAESAAGLLDALRLFPTYERSLTPPDAGGIRPAALGSTALRPSDVSSAPLNTIASFTPSAPDGLGGWYVAAPTVELASDPQVTPPADIYYSYDSTASPTAYGGPFTAAGGAHTLWYWSIDPSQPALPVSYVSTSTLVDTSTPDAPAGLAAAPAAGPRAGGTQIVLSWTASVPNTASGIAVYEVFQDGARVATVASPTVTYTAIALSPATTYQFQVRALSIAGAASPLTPAVSGTTATLGDPSAPAYVYARGTDGQTVYVDWMPSADAQFPATYVVSRLDGTTWSSVATITDPYQSAYVDTGRDPDTGYAYHVTVIDPGGQSDPSPVATATTGFPNPPRELVAAASTQTVPAGIMLTWQAAGNPVTTRYYVYRSRVSAAGPATSTPSDSLLVTITPSPIATPFLLDSSVTSQLPYYYRVAAVDATGNVGDLSVEAMATLPKPAVAPAYDPHGDQVTSDDCAACHRTHSAASPSLVVGLDEATPTTFVPPTMGPAPRATWDGQLLCLSCHDGSRGLDIASPLNDPLSAPPSGSRHAAVTRGSTVQGNLFCGSCHSSHRSAPTVSNPFYLDSNGVSAGNAYCYACHGTGTILSSGDVSFFEGSVHNTVAQTSPAAIRCNACHATIASTNARLLDYASYMSCAQCHSGTGTANAPDIFSLITASTEPTSHHPVTARDQASSGARIACANCHNSMRVTAAAPLVDPAAPFTTVWAGDQVSFCVRCHDGAYPSAAQTEPYVAAPLGSGGTTLSLDVESAYETNVHGYGTATDGNAHLRPEMGYATGVTLQCTACHDPHGAVNTYALKQNVGSLDGTLFKSGLLVERIPGGGADFRFFCNACHDLTPENHATAAASVGVTVDITQLPTDCTGSGCHQHTMAPLGPGTSVTDTVF